jgi:hypothetical protein
MTNIRANITTVGGGLLGGTTQLVASVAISGSTSLLVNNPVIVAGFTEQGLNTSLSSAGNSFLQCNSVSVSSALAAVGLLKFSENFGTAFKTRVAPIPPNTSGQTGAGNAQQNIPGAIYNSESGFVVGPAFVSTIGPAGAPGPFSFAVNQIGLADYGTRLKAVFSNIPSGLHVYVSWTNVSSVTSGDTANPGPFSPSSYAVLVNGETTPDGNDTVPAILPNFVNGKTGVYDVPVSNGSATAVWEVVNTNPSLAESFSFAVFTSYTANQNQNVPAVGTVNVIQSFAPTPSVVFSATAAATPTSQLTIPRFAESTNSHPLFTIQLCQTLLLFPFITNQNGFDTGIAISNTTMDPLTGPATAPQSGICKLTFYDGSGKPGPVGIDGVTDLTKSAPVASGTSAVNLISTLAPGFQGYMFAQCNFQLAHGFAFISDLGARNLAMGYLALVVPPSAFRPSAPVAEVLAH